MTKKELRETKLNLDDIRFVVEWFEEGKVRGFYEARVKALNVFYSLQKQVSNKLQNEGVLKNEVTSIKNC